MAIGLAINLSTLCLRATFNDRGGEVPPKSLISDTTQRVELRLFMNVGPPADSLQSIAVDVVRVHFGWPIHEPVPIH